jgi:outer membrane biosynthesis protein TonB
MRRWDRIVLLVGLVALAPVLAGCENFDPDSLDVFHLNEKKKLTGDRKPLFPEGVPGVTQGIPPEYLKENQPPPETAQTPLVAPDDKSAAVEPDNKAAANKKPSKTAAVEPVETPKPNLKPKRKPKPRTATTRPAAPSQNAGQQQPQPAWPAPGQPQQPQQTQSPWPNSGQATNAPPWPSAPAPGTFSR